MKRIILRNDLEKKALEETANLATSLIHENIVQCYDHWIEKVLERN